MEEVSGCQWTSFFGGEAQVVMIAVTWVRFLYFPEVLGNATKFRFRESRVIVKTR